MSNILNTLHEIQEEQHLVPFYTSLCEDPFIELIPTQEQVKLFFTLFQQGAEYVCNIYGEGVLASDMRFFHTLFVQEIGETVSKSIGYHPSTDTVDITASLLAKVCVSFQEGTPNGVFPNDHLPHKRGVRGEDLTILYAIEECYHRYQRHVKQYPIIYTGKGNRDHFIEKEIEAVWAKAIVDFNMTLYYIYD